MIQEFTTNVQRLFAEIVTGRHPKNSHDADELLSVLQRKVTLPVRVIKKDKRICMVYDNVTIELRHDLSAMKIVYNSDYQMTFNKLSSCDVHQLSEFILSLERDIPQMAIHLDSPRHTLQKEAARPQTSQACHARDRDEIALGTGCR